MGKANLELRPGVRVTRDAPLAPERQPEVSDSEDQRVLSGYAAVFYDGTPGTEYDLGWGIVERFAPGSFGESIAKDDVLGLFQHDMSKLLGRTAADTLRLREDDVGLRYEIDLPRSPLGDDIREQVSRRDIQGSSLTFFPRSYDVDEPVVDSEDVPTILTHTAVTVDDVGPVVRPAYTGTTAAMESGRAAGGADPVHELVRKWVAGRDAERAAIANRVRAMSVIADAGI